MRCVMVMYDSLNRRHLPPYGCDWVHAPNFTRLAQRTAAFDTSYVCSMPCMPARRDLHTGRPGFLHRYWGPLEPFDDSMPQMLDHQGIHSALISDHYHYWEDGGATYHNRYSTWQAIRGQEGDPWMGQVAPEPVDPGAIGRNAEAYRPGGPQTTQYQDRVNRKFIAQAADFPSSRTFSAGLDFIERNHAADDWFLQIEAFDPHEPFFSDSKFKAAYTAHYESWARTDGRIWDWMDIRAVSDQDTPELINHMRHEYASLMTMCDARLGSVLDAFDRHNLWDDTMLIVWTDHGILLSEHGWWGKNRMPLWDEIARTPLFIWDPRTGVENQRRQALVQPAIDLPVTLLNYFGIAPTPDMTGRDLAPVIRDDTPVRDAAVFGYHGQQVNVTDGRYVYMRGPANDRNAPLYEYTLMPTHMRERFAVEELRDRITLAEPFSFTKGCQVMRVGGAEAEQDNCDDYRTAVRRDGHALYDTAADPAQEAMLVDPQVEDRMIDLMVQEMRRVDAPAEQFQRLGLTERLASG